MQTKITIIIADNNPDSADDLKHKLRSYDYIVHSIIKSGERAIQVGKNVCPDLFLINTEIAGKIDGINTGKIIREQYNIPVVYITTSWGMTAFKKAIKSDEFAYLVRPFHDKELYYVISTELHRYNMKMKLSHISNVLDALRQINQLIYKQKDKEKLIDGCCRYLVKIRGYNYACLVLLNEDREYLACTTAGTDKDKSNIFKMIRQQELPPCYKKTLNRQQIFLVQKPSFDCGNCVLKEKYYGCLGMSIRLEYKDRIYGILKINTDKKTVIKRQEKMLLKEVAQDVAFALYNIDLAEEKELANKRLKQSEQKYKQLLETLNEGVWVIDEQSITTYVNPRMAAILGYTVEEMTGKHLFHFMDQNQILKCRQLLIKRRQGIKEEHFIEFFKKDGSIIYSKLTTSPIINKRGEYTGAIVCVQDITEQKLLEREVLEISKQEQESIGKVLHDSLGQHLTGIAFRSKVLENKLANNHMPEFEDAKQITVMTNQAIEQIRLLAKGLLYFELEPNELIPAINGFVHNIKDLFGVNCTFSYDNDFPIKDHIASVQLYRIIQEAVNNAIKHGKPNKIKITLKQKERDIVLTVADNGHGKLKNLSSKKGLGLKIMQYRTSIIGAQLLFNQSKQSGITVTCIIPGNIKTEVYNEEF